jgi:hypothetical protein
MFKHTFIAVTAGALLAAGAAAAAPTQNASMLIRHQVRGCHSWSVNGGTFKPSQTLTLTRGSSLTIKNDDVMPHKLVKLSGPALTFGPAGMSHGRDHEALRVHACRCLPLVTHDEGRRGTIRPCR